MQSSSNQPSSRIFYFLATTVLAWYIYNFYFGERIFHNQGLGWDGMLYTDLAAKFHAYLKHKVLSLYHAQRVFPSFILFLVTRLTHYKPSLGDPLLNASHMLRLFYIFNILNLVVAMYAYTRIARLSGWNLSIALIGFSGLFLNFFILKAGVYNPTLTDTIAFCISIYMLYFYLRNQLIPLLMVSFIGAFTHPIFLLSGVILLFFPYTSHQASSYRYTLPIRMTHPLTPHLVASIFAFTLLLASLYATALVSIKNQHHVFVTVLSYLGLFAFGFGMVKPFCVPRFAFNLKMGRTLLVLVFLIACKLLQYSIANMDPGALTPARYLRDILIYATLHPFVFLIAHLFYVGPIIIMFVLYWPSLVRAAYRKGTGLFLITLMFGLLSIDSESRHLVIGLPFFTYLLCEMLQVASAAGTIRLSMRFVMFFLGLSLLISKCWLPINVAGYPYKDILVLDDFLSFPYQWYMMNFGPLINNEVYTIELAIFFILFIGLWKFKQICSLFKTQVSSQTR